jgi:hypothetical protein
MHRRDNMQFGQALVCKFLRCEHLGNDAVHLAALFQHRISEHAHDAFVGSAVNELKFVSNQHVCQFARSRSVFRPPARVRTAVNADPAHRSNR